MVFDPAETTPTRLFSADGQIEVLIQPDAFDRLLRLKLSDRRLQDAAVAGGTDGRVLRFAMELLGEAVAQSQPQPAPGAEEDETEADPADEPLLQPSTPLEVTVRGVGGYPAGASLPLYVFNAVSKRYEQSGASAVVQADASSIKFQLAAFGRYALYGLLPEEVPPPPPGAIRLVAASTQVRRLSWAAPDDDSLLGLNLYRALGDGSFSKLNAEPLVTGSYVDYLATPAACRYHLTALNRRGLESLPGPVLDSPALVFDLLALFGTARLRAPRSLCWDAAAERLLVADPAARRIFSFAGDGAFLGEQAAYKASAPMLEPLAVAIAPDGSRVYVADGERRRVYILDSSFAYLGEFGGQGAGPGEFERPAAIAAEPDRVLVADSASGRIQSFTPLGVYLATLSTASDPVVELDMPGALLVPAAGGLLALDSAAGRLLGFDEELQFAESFELAAGSGGPLLQPQGLTEDFRQRIYISDTGQRRVVVLEDGELLFHFGSEGSLAVELGVDYGPAGLAYDPRSGYLYVADPGNRRIVVFIT